MTPEEIDALCSSDDDVVPRELIRTFIASDDLRVLGAVYQLTERAWYQIEPELEMEEATHFIATYLLRCVVEHPSDDDFLTNGYIAGMELARTLTLWRTLGDKEIQVVREVAKRVRDAYVAGDDGVRDRILNGFLEHAFEDVALRPFFADWRDDPLLAIAHTDALAFAEWVLAGERPN